MTGMEAISNAVTVFEAPQDRNARTTLVLMAAILGAMFLAVSIFAALTHSVPFVSGTPTREALLWSYIIQRSDSNQDGNIQWSERQAIMKDLEEGMANGATEGFALGCSI